MPHANLTRSRWSSKSKHNGISTAGSLGKIIRIVRVASAVLGLLKQVEKASPKAVDGKQLIHKVLRDFNISFNVPSALEGKLQQGAAF